MKTAIELGKDGTQTVFHRRGQKAWTHPEDDPHMMDFDNGFRRGAPTRQPCPACEPGAFQKRVVALSGLPEGAGIAS